MKIEDIHIGESAQTTEEKNKYIPGSSEKKRACVMYLFFGIIVSLSKKDFSPFEFYHLRQSIWLWILILPVVLISFIPVIRWISIIILVALLGILGFSFANAWTWKYFDESDKSVLALFSGVWWWFLDLFELWIKSTWAVQKNNSSEIYSTWVSDLEEDIQKSNEQMRNQLVDDSTDRLSGLQNQNTTLQEDIEKMDEKNAQNSDSSELDKA